MEPRSLRVGPDGVIHSATRNQLAANPLHNLSYAQNVGYALPGFKPTLASSESVGHDSILKGWQYLSPYGVSSLNVSNVGSSAGQAAGASTFPGLNYKASSASASAPTHAAAAAAASASAAAIKAQKQSTVSVEGYSQHDVEHHVNPKTSDLYHRLNSHQFRLSLDSAALSQHAQSGAPQFQSVPSVSASSAMLSRSAVTALPSVKPWADFVPGGELGSATAAAAATQLPHTLAVSQKSNIGRDPTTRSDFSRSGESTDRVCFVRCLLILLCLNFGILIECM
jgi:hypothetical protein